MIGYRHIHGSAHEAGALNALLAVWGFVDETTFVTKAGEVGVVYRLRGRDAEGRTHAERRAIVHQFEAALRVLDEHCRIYQYILKQITDPFVAPACRFVVAHAALQQRATYLNERRHSLYRLDHYLVLLYEPRTVAHTTVFSQAWRRLGVRMRGRGFAARVAQVLEGDLDRAIDTLHRKARAFEVQLRECGLTRLTKAEAFGFFRRLLNDSPAIAAAVPLRYDTHVDYFAADTALECHRDHLRLGSRYMKVLSMKEPPAKTFATILSDLWAVSGEMVACLEWQRMASDRMRRDIQGRRRHFFHRRVALANYVMPDTRPEEMLIDDSAGATVRQLGEALTDLEVHGHFFGGCSLTLVLHGPDLRAVQEQAAEVIKVLGVHDGSVFDETYNALNAWLATIPGNSAFNLRRVALLETNVADLSFLFTHESGDGGAEGGLRLAPLAIFETSSQTPYAYHLHVHDVGHTLVLGATGAGKSFLLNFLITHAQQYEPLTTIIDVGHSYRKLTAVLDGRYVELGLQPRDITINPFDLDAPAPEQLHFLHQFLRVLLEGEDGYRLSEREDRETYEALQNLFVLDRAQRRLFTVANLLPRALAGRLHKWIEGGRYGSLFDNATDTLTFERLQVIALDEMRAFPALLDPLLFYVLHRVRARVRDPQLAGTLKLCVMDEVWCPIQHPLVRAYVHEELKTERKYHAAMILATQTPDDFVAVDLLRTVVESCPTRLLLANPSLDRRQYADLFQLNEQELDLLAGLLPRQQLLLKRPDLTKVLTLNVDRRTYWLYTNSPVDNAQAAAVFREFGVNAGLDRLAASV